METKTNHVKFINRFNRISVFAKSNYSGRDLLIGRIKSFSGVYRFNGEWLGPSISAKALIEIAEKLNELNGDNNDKKTK